MAGWTWSEVSSNHHRLVRVLKKQCLPNWEIGRTTVDGCLLAGVSSNLEGNTFSLAEIVIGTRADSQVSTPSNTVFL